MKTPQAAAIIAAISTALALTACTNETNSLANSTDTPDSKADSAITESTDDRTHQPSASSLNIEKAATQPPAGTATKIEGPDGTPIYTSEFTTYTDKNGNPADYTDGNLGYAVCSGFAYIAPPGELCLTSIDNADIYNEDTLSFAGVPDTKFQDYVRINVGDKVNGLTVKSASATFGDDEMNLPENKCGKYFSGCECEFIGDMELVGYACAVKEDAYGIQAGDILFVPQGECPLPSMSFKTDEETGVHHLYYTGSNYGLTWVNQYGQIFLGNTQETTADISCLPSDGTFVKVKVVIDNIRMTSNKDWIDLIQANIVTIERQ